MNSITRFCEERNISKSMQSAFNAYCRTDYALKFELKDGDTVGRIVTNLTEEEVQRAWNSFVLAFRDAVLPK